MLKMALVAWGHLKSRLDERGQDLMEYLVLAAVVAVAVIVGIGLYSGALNTWFTGVAAWIGGGAAPGGPTP